MALGFRSDKANRQRAATGAAVARHPILVGALLTVVVLAVFAVTSLPSTPALSVKPPRSAPALVQVPAGDRLVAVHPALTIAPSPARGTPATRHAIASRARVSRIWRRKAKLSLTLGAGRNNAQIKAVTVRLPRGMAFSHANKPIAAQIVLRAHGVRLRLTEKISHRKLTIRLKTTAPTVHVTITGPSITVTKALAHRIKTRELKVLYVRITTTDANHSTRHLILQQPAR